jgi:hypothetical protein
VTVARRRLTDEQRALRQVTEAEFLAQVIDLAHICGYRVAHFRPAYTARGWRTPVQGDGAGFPDTLILGHGRLIVAELKSARGKATPGQLAWLAAFADAGIQAYVWSPGDLDEIVGVLRAAR